MQALSPIVRALALALGLAGGAAPRADDPPNVLFVTIDDLNDWVGALGGHPQAHTPHLDRLAERGVLFTNAHCQAPVCTPSRASLFTGQLPSSTGLYFLEPALANAPELSEIETLVERFARAGYATLGVGKLHHGPEAPYFQEYGGALGGFGPLANPKLHYPGGHPLWDWGPYPEPFDESAMPDVRVADWAIERLGEERAQPFFLGVGFWRPHVPMLAPQPWFDRIGPESEVVLPTVLESDRDDLSDYARALTIGLPAPRHAWMLEHEAWRSAVHAYLASVAFVDHQLGRVLDALEASSYADNTLVVLLADHGFHLGEKQRWAKRSLWEESTRVPLVFAGPGIARGRSASPVMLLDVYPTLMDVCGLEHPPNLDGHSLAPLLERPLAVWPYAAITTFGPGNHALRSTRWRYVRYADGSEELYDHSFDPHEWHSRSARPDVTGLLLSLGEHLPAFERTPVSGTAGDGYVAWRAAQALRAQSAEDISAED